MDKPTPRTPLYALLAVLVLDRLLKLLPARPIAGVVDEAAHLATGALVFGAWPSSDEGYAAGLAAGSVLIDVDHVPELWGRAWLRPRGVRPLPHSLATPALVAGLARSGFGRGAAVGLTAHLVRDLATGKTRVALLWPLTRRGFSIRYRTYFALLAALASYATAVAALAPRPPDVPQTPAEGQSPPTNLARS